MKLWALKPEAGALVELNTVSFPPLCLQFVYNPYTGRVNEHTSSIQDTENSVTNKPWERYNIIKIPLNQGGPTLPYKHRFRISGKKKPIKKKPNKQSLISVMPLKTSVLFQIRFLFLHAAITRCKHFSHFLIIRATNYEDWISPCIVCTFLSSYLRHIDFLVQLLKTTVKEQFSP